MLYLNLRHVYKKHFFNFWCYFMRIWFQSFLKVQNRAKKKNLKNIEGVSKTQNFMPSSNPLENFQNKSPTN
jgi:hypothetical protein